MRKIFFVIFLYFFVIDFRTDFYGDLRKLDGMDDKIFVMEIVDCYQNYQKDFFAIMKSVLLQKPLKLSNHKNRKLYLYMYNYLKGIEIRNITTVTYMKKDNVTSLDYDIRINNAKESLYLYIRRIFLKMDKRFSFLRYIDFLENLNL